MTSEALRQRCEQHVAALRRRIDELKDHAAGQPLVTVDFVAEVEKTLDGWEIYQEALQEDRNRGERGRLGEIPLRMGGSIVFTVLRASGELHLAFRLGHLGTGGGGRSFLVR